MNRISKLQLISLMLIGDAFALFCLRGGICIMTAIGFASGSIIQLFLALPLARYYDSGKNLADTGKAVRILLLGYVILYGGTLFSALWHTSSVIYIPYENSGMYGRLMTGGLIALVCVYVSSSGIKALARSAVIAMGLGVLCVAMVTVSAVIQSDISNIFRPDGRSLPSEVIRGFAASGGLGSFIVLLSFTAEDKTDTASMYFTCKVILSFIMLFTSVIVTGGIMDVLDFPVTTAAQLSQPFPVQRTDSLFLIVFSVLAVFSIAVQASAAEYLAAGTIPRLKRFRCTAVLFMMVAIGTVLYDIGTGIISYALSSFIIMMIVPLESLLKKGGGEMKREKA